MSRKPELVRESTIIKGMITSGAKPGRLNFRPDGSFTVFNDDGSLTESSSPKIEEPSLFVRFDHRWGGRNGQ
jgi:hypothetical protein